MAGLLNKLKSKTPVEVKGSKEKKQTIVVESNVLFGAIKDFAEAKRQLDLAKAKTDELNAEIKDLAIPNFFDEYSRANRNPGSVIIEAHSDAGSQAEIMFMPTDNYLKCDAKKAADLRSKFGHDIVSEEDIVTVDINLFKKYEKQFEDLLKKIAGADADKIFNLTTEYSVAKGTVDNLADIAAKRKSSPSNVAGEVGVIIAIKGPKVITDNEPIAKMKAK